MRKLIPLCICWAYASGTNAYARCKHQQLMRALVLHKSFKTLWHGLYFSLPDAVPWKASEALSEYSAADEKEMQGKKIGNLRMFLLNFCKMRRRSNFRISPSRLFPNYTSFAQANYITYMWAVRQTFIKFTDFLTNILTTSEGTITASKALSWTLKAISWPLRNVFLTIWAVKI